MSEYLNPAQRKNIEELLSGLTARTEWPTWLILLAVHAAWVGALIVHESLGKVLTSMILIVVCAWYMSIQHELVHGHPTRFRWVNKVLGFAPLAVWFPYTLYAESHLRHHNDKNLTLPDVDPETHYVSDRRWHSSGTFMRILYTARKSFWGRFLLGPAMALVPTYLEAIKQPLNGNFKYVAMWLTHLSLLGGMLTLVHSYAGISPIHYVFGIAYPALSLAMIRSYYEHRAADNCKHRIVINEAAWPMRLLYLNNNYHLVHHDLPSLPWYLLPRVYRANRADYIARCDDFLVPGYGNLMRRFGFRRIDEPVHPYRKTKSVR